MEKFYVVGSDNRSRPAPKRRSYGHRRPRKPGPGGRKKWMLAAFGQLDQFFAEHPRGDGREPTSSSDRGQRRVTTRRRAHRKHNRHRQRHRIRVAALGAATDVNFNAKPRLVRRGRAKISCFPWRLNAILARVEKRFGHRVRVISGYRSRRHNRRVGGARRSYHLKCMAADIAVPKVNKYRLARFLKNIPGRGGVGTYACSGFVHIDVGPRRAWHWGCRRKKYRKFARLHGRRHARRIAHK